jgi:threonine/homoserine/homoserine lactone efflux protein
MSVIWAMCAFALTMSITPGPVNVIALSSGVNHGFFRTFPFVSGATLGFTALLYLLGAGVLELMMQFPLVMQMLGYAGTLFLLYVAFSIVRAKEVVEGERTAPCPKFWQGWILQWLNPKAWIACMSGLTAFVSRAEMGSLLFFCMIYFFLCYVGVGFWAVLGAKTQKLLRTSKQMQVFNWIMGTVLACVALYLLVI